MIAVHPLDYPLFRALFDGVLPIGDFFTKRLELLVRQANGECLSDLVDEAESFVLSYRSDPTECCAPRGLLSSLSKPSAHDRLLDTANRAVSRAVQ